MKDRQKVIASTEYMAVRDALLLFRYADGRTVDPHGLTERLLDMGAARGTSGHCIAAELRKLFEDLERMKRFVPYAPGWFEALVGRLLYERTQYVDPIDVIEPLAEHADLARHCERERAEEFLQIAGSRFAAIQLCWGQIKGSRPVQASLLTQCALWMLSEGWGAVVPRKAPVMEFGEGKKKLAG